MKVLGVVMAGGRNVRFGGLKAFAEVRGRRIVDRVVDALRTVTPELVVIANDVEAYAPLGLPIRSDEIASGAALAGIFTALHWAAERNCTGIVTAACDMPFASGPLLQHMVERAVAEQADIVAPESGGPRGIEPLFAYYSRNCEPAIARAIAREDLRMISFHADVKRAVIGIEEVRAFGDPDVLFMNVNTTEDLVHAEQLAR